MSRWLVGSSRKSRFFGSRSSFARARRDRSPPEKPLTTRSGSSPQKRKAREVLPRGLDGEVAAHAADVVHGGQARVDVAEVLVEVALLQVGPALDDACVLRAAPPGEELEQRGLARAVRARRRRCARRAARADRSPRRARALPARRRGPWRRARCRPSAPTGAKRNATRSAVAHTSSGRSMRSSLSSILRRLWACLVFCPAMFLRMKSSVLATRSCCLSARARSRARSSSRATT